jgi:tRNA modification GTPase
MEDTITAISTAPGRGAIAVVRLSGDSAFEIGRRHVSPWPELPNTVWLADVTDSGGRILDKALVTVFRAPNSFTGEDVVEISSHGGLVVPQSIVAAFLDSGARQAEPGEFTRRAVANGKIDIMQAEAIADLVDARSRSMQAAALSQLDGALSRRITELRAALLQLEAFLAYDIDFPEEDDGPISRERIVSNAESTLAALRALIATGEVGEMVREGAVVVIAGPPNVGKSSLFNALLGRARAIVTDIPGTTRDALEAVVDAGELPVRLVDTAGLRESSDYVERLGIEVSRKYLEAADIVLACGESLEQIEVTLNSLGELAHKRFIRVLTKSDLVTKGANMIPAESGAVTVSAATGAGLGALIEKIEETLRADHPTPADTPLLTRARHLTAVKYAAEELEQFLRVWTVGSFPATVAAIHVRSAGAALEELIGTVDVEHVLDVVFSSFCVGK